MTPPRDDDILQAATRRLGTAADPRLSAVLLARARQARLLRATMSSFLPGDLLVDPAWDMMIDLFIAAATLSPLFVKDLILLSGESPASAMRRIDRLQNAALLLRHHDTTDHRRVHVCLTEKGVAAMAAMLEHLFDARPDAADGVGAPVSFSPASAF